MVHRDTSLLGREISHGCDGPVCDDSARSHEYRMRMRGPGSVTQGKINRHERWENTTQQDTPTVDRLRVDDNNKDGSSPISQSNKVCEDTQKDGG